MGVKKICIKKTPKKTLQCLFKVSPIQAVVNNIGSEKHFLWRKMQKKTFDVKAVFMKLDTELIEFNG